MGVINTSDLKNGIKVIFDGAPWVVLNVDFVKPGKGAAFYKIRIQNLLTNNTLDKTLRSGEKVEEADVMETDMDYLYFDGDGYVFMDQKTFEQYSIKNDAVGNSGELLLENMECSVMLWNNEPINIRLPNQVAYEIEYTEPAVKGDTQSRVMKEAKLTTGATVTVPTFIDIGETVIIDTRTREYAGRKQ
jgi:elongation factor P